MSLFCGTGESGYISTLVAQLVRALHRNRKAAGSIPAKGSVVAFFTTASG